MVQEESSADKNTEEFDIRGVQSKRYRKGCGMREKSAKYYWQTRAFNYASLLRLSPALAFRSNSMQRQYFSTFMARRNKIALRESETNTRDLKLICKILKGEFVVTLRFYGWTFLAGTFYISSRLQAERRGGEVKDA